MADFRYEVRLSRKALKGLRTFGFSVRSKIAAAVTALQDDSFPSYAYDVKRLVGLHGFYRIRIGEARIVYCVHEAEGVIEVLKIERRGETTYRF